MPVGYGGRASDSRRKVEEFELSLRLGCGFRSYLGLLSLMISVDGEIVDSDLILAY